MAISLARAIALGGRGVGACWLCICTSSLLVDALALLRERRFQLGDTSSEPVLVNPLESSIPATLAMVLTLVRGRSA